MVARRPASVTSELLGLTQPVISHHVTILVDAGSFAPREALRVAVLLTCPLSLGRAGRRSRGSAALPHLACACAGAGPDHAGGGDADGPAGRARLSWDGPAGLMASRGGEAVGAGTLREMRRGWWKLVSVSHCSYSAAV